MWRLTCDVGLTPTQRVQEAQRIAIRELKDQDFDGKAVDSAAALEAEVCMRLGLWYSSCHDVTLLSGCDGRKHQAKKQSAV